MCTYLIKLNHRKTVHFTTFTRNGKIMISCEDDFIKYVNTLLGEILTRKIFAIFTNLVLPKISFVKISPNKVAETKYFFNLFSVPSKNLLKFFKINDRYHTGVCFHSLYLIHQFLTLWSVGKHVRKIRE